MENVCLPKGVTRGSNKSLSAGLSESCLELVVEHMRRRPSIVPRMKSELLTVQMVVKACGSCLT